jgi:hypothetical protein
MSQQPNVSFVLATGLRVWVDVPGAPLGCSQQGTIQGTQRPLGAKNRFLSEKRTGEEGGHK